MVSEALKSGNILGAIGIDKSSFGMGTISSVFLWILIGIVFLGEIGRAHV